MNQRQLQLLLRCCRELITLKKIHAGAMISGLLSAHQSMACKLFRRYAEFGGKRDARKVFDNIPSPDIVSYTSLIYLYLRAQLPGRAFVAFSHLVRCGLTPDSFSVVGALSACGRGGNLIGGRVVHGMILRFHLLGSEPIVGNALVDMYCRNVGIKAAELVFDHMMAVKDLSSWTSLINGFVMNNDLLSARRVFHEMPSRNDVAWNSMITGFIQHKMPAQGLIIFKQMKAAGDCSPTVPTFVAVLSACADIGSINQSQVIHCCISKSSLSSNVTISNTLIDSYSKGGCPGLARKIFEEMRNRDVYSWTSMISGYAFHSQGAEALVVFHKMLESRAIPNEVTFLSVLTACNHGGLVVEAQKVFDEMIRSHHLDPDIEHYGCMVDLLGRVGYIEEAVEFVNKIPIKPDAVIWRSLLSASLVHGNLDVAEMAGQKVIIG